MAPGHGDADVTDGPPVEPGPGGGWLAAAAAHLHDRRAMWRVTRIALVVGTVFTLVNQLDVMLAGGSPWLALKVPVNYLTPFVVASLGYISAARRP